MSHSILFYALSLSQILLCLALACAAFRIVRGPRAQDRVLGFDTLYVSAMLLLLTLGIRNGQDTYFESALVVAVFGFVSTAAMAKFLMRGEVIE